MTTKMRSSSYIGWCISKQASWFLQLTNSFELSQSSGVRHGQPTQGGAVYATWAGRNSATRT